MCVPPTAGPASSGPASSGPASSGPAPSAATPCRAAPATPSPPARPATGSTPLLDVFAARPFDAAPVLFAFATLAAAGATAPILWVQDRMARREGGHLHEAGLRQATDLVAPLVRVEVSHPRDVLWAMEEGAGTAALSGVVGEVHGDPAALDFTATKRLVLRAKRAGTPVWLLRAGAHHRGLSAARERWCLGSAPSARHPHDPAAPGAPRLAAELFRARSRPPASWILAPDPGARRAAGSGAGEAGPPLRAVA